MQQTKYLHAQQLPDLHKISFFAFARVFDKIFAW